MRALTLTLNLINTNHYNKPSSLIMGKTWDRSSHHKGPAKRPRSSVNGLAAVSPGTIQDLYSLTRIDRIP